MSKAKNTKSSPSSSKSPPSSQTGGPRWLFIALVAAGALVLTVAAWVLLRGGGGSTQSASPTQAAQPAQAGQTSQTVSGPRLSVAQDIFDYGDVKVNQPVEAVFRVTNVGDKPLQILEQPLVEVVEGC